MYGTVMRYRLKPGSETAALALSDELAADPPLGFVAAYTYRLDPSGDPGSAAEMAAALGEQGLDLAIVTLQPPHRPGVLEPLAAKLSEL